MIEHDGHIHSPFCPHGSRNSFASYCEKAIEIGLKGITFAEHAPLPEGFIDPTPDQDSCMKMEVFPDYVQEINALKKTYQDRLTIFLGLEVDFIEGYETETKEFLEQYGSVLDDGLLSVHFLKTRDNYVCLDYSPDSFKELSESYGSVDEVYRHYFQTVQQSISANLGRFKPKRIGHLTLVRKFNKMYSPTHTFKATIHSLLSLIKERGYTLDYNGAGVLKPLCGEPYPDEQIAVAASKLGIPLIYGSDAHQTKAMQAGVEQLSPAVSCSIPKLLNK